MKQRKRLVFLLLLVLGVVVLVSIWKKSEQPSPPASPANATLEFKPAAALSKETADIVPEENRSGQKSDAQEQTRILKLIVQNGEVQPLEGAQIRVWIGRTAGVTNQFEFTNSVATDANGFADLPWPVQDLAWLALSASKDGYSSRKMVWDAAHGDAIPPSYTLKLKSGVNLGGVVVDPDGNAISNANLKLTYYPSGVVHAENKGEAPDFGRQKQSSDAQGRWRATNLPPELLDRIVIEVKHRDFLGARVDIGADEKVESELRSGTHKIILPRGLQARGRVLDDQGQPIAGAQVWVGERNASERRATKTDEQGGFVFNAVTEGETVFSVTAKGRKPESKAAFIMAGMEEIIFRLAAGGVIRAQVLNEAGEPIPKVRVALEGHRDVGRSYEFETQTDQDGRFVWDAAPNEPMPFYFGANGYEQKRGQMLKQNADNIVTLRRYRQVQGLVLDANTRKPVTRFRVRVGRSSPEHSASGLYGAMSQSDFNPPDGRFTMEMKEEENNTAVVSAVGYEDQTQVLTATQKGVMEATFALKASDGLTAILLAPDGHPAANATVAIAPKTRSQGRIWLRNGRLQDAYKATIATTDADGKFSLSVSGDDETVVAASAVGFATAPVWQVRSQSQLALQLYGRIKGEWSIAGEPVAGEVISFETPLRSLVTDRNQSTTDATGHFTLAKVPPGKIFVVRRVQQEKSYWEESHRTQVFVPPGETIQVALGQAGAVIAGRVSFETPQTNKNLIMVANLLLSDQTCAILRQSPEGRNLLRDWARNRHLARVKPDGSFLMDSVPAGSFTVYVTAQKSTDRFPADAVAVGQVDVTVPESASPMLPIQLGEIILKPPQP